ncbi:hypothetical protein RDI58_022445 [Solanum bulbocastanum]|uniref:RNase H type-1 domain-containing protein n=1 Tax=Solanum bulbocastanum TaxID=147425 RepID=A0AAN8TAQ3_SOLBU
MDTANARHLQTKHCGATGKEPRSGEIGGVICDHHEQWIWGFTKKLKHTIASQEEFNGIMQGLKLARFIDEEPRNLNGDACVPGVEQGS